LFSCRPVPHAGSGVVRIDPLHILAGCRTRLYEAKPGSACLLA